MKVLLTIVLGTIGLFWNNSFAQSEEGSNIENPNLTKRVEVVSPKKKDSKEITNKNSSVQKANPYHKTTDPVSSNNLAQPKPATRTTSVIQIEKIEYSLDNNNSSLTNLLSLIELKERVNQSGNLELLESSEYSTLLADISKLRTEFDNHVESTGIENCSTSEQSHYLAFLKEEGKEEAYKNAMAKLK
ncbi:MAG: hypothetical protein H6599_03645 [Flavobacteriales bacterium]|nr:hypothetical protein [Flavobacteriales bacterium]